MNNLGKQLKLGKKMRGVTSSIRPRKLKGLKMAKRIKAFRKMNVANKLRRSFTRSTTTTRPTTSSKWISIVKKKISSSTPKFPHYYNNNGRNGTTTNNNNNNMIIIHNNTSITGNEELDNRTSCVDEAKDITPFNLKQDNHIDDLDTIKLREEKAAIRIQSVFRGHLARRACRALKSLVRLQAMVRGVCVRRQARIALDCMNALVRLQFRVRTRQLLPNSPSNDTVTVDHPSLD